MYFLATTYMCASTATIIRKRRRVVNFTGLTDRRPSSNADPYLVTGKIMSTIMEDVEVPEIAPLDKQAA
jgi:hypothetical protein